MPITSLLQSWIPLFVIQEFGAIVVLLLLLFVIGGISVRRCIDPTGTVGFSESDRVAAHSRPDT